MIDFREIPFHEDDFSTGYNGMTALNYYAPHFAKLDRSLISNIHAI